MLTEIHYIDNISLNIPNDLIYLCNFIKNNITNNSKNIIIIIANVNNINEHILKCIELIENNINYCSELCKINKLFVNIISDISNVQFNNDLLNIFIEFENTLHFATLFGISDKIKSNLISFGKLIPIQIISAYLNKLNIPIKYIDSRNIINTNNNYINSNINKNTTCNNINAFFNIYNNTFNNYIMTNNIGYYIEKNNVNMDDNDCLKNIFNNNDNHNEINYTHHIFNDKLESVTFVNDNLYINNIFESLFESVKIIKWNMLDIIR
jgi:hypothetical protein